MCILGIFASIKTKIVNNSLFLRTGGGWGIIVGHFPQRAGHVGYFSQLFGHYSFVLKITLSPNRSHHPDVWDSNKDSPSSFVLGYSGKHPLGQV